MERLEGRGIAITGGAGDIGAAMGAEVRRFSTMGQRSAHLNR